MLKQVALNNAFLGFQYLVGSLVPLFLVPYIVRQIGLDAFGSLGVASTLAGYGTAIVLYTFNLTGPALLARSSDPAVQSEALARIADAKLMLLLAILPLLGLAAHLISRDRSEQAIGIALALVLPPLAASMNYVWLVQFRDGFKQLAGVSMLSSTAALAIGFVAVSGMSALSIALAALVLNLGALVSGAYTLRLATRSLSGRPAEGRWRNAHRELRENWWLFFSQFVATIYSQSGPLVVGLLLSRAEAGAYSAAERIVFSLLALSGLLYTAASPSLAKLHATDRASYFRLTRWIVLGHLAITSSIIAIVLLFWQWIAAAALGFLEAEIGSMVKIGLACLPLSIFGPLVTGHLTLEEKSHQVLQITLAALAISATIGITLVMHIGASGWLLAMTISHVVVAGAYFWHVIIRRSKFSR